MQNHPKDITRRGLLGASAWTVPVLAVAIQSPALAASGTGLVTGTVATKGAGTKQVNLTSTIAGSCAGTYQLRITGAPTCILNCPGGSFAWTSTFPITSPISGGVATSVLLASNSSAPGATWRAPYQVLCNGAVVGSGNLTFIW